jgi:hypothetical protein
MSDDELHTLRARLAGCREKFAHDNGRFDLPVLDQPEELGM